VTGEGTIYPLLARLRRQGLVETSWRESESGPPRRYYRLSSAGKDALDEFCKSWRSLRTTVDALLDDEHGGSTRISEPQLADTKAERNPDTKVDKDKERTW
jgi:PadR family transcriptional regulator PadR